MTMTKQNSNWRHLSALMLGLILIAGSHCGPGGGGSMDTNTEVPKGEPPFTPLGQSWVIDNAGVLSPNTIEWGHEALNRLTHDGVAEVILLVQNNVKNPIPYATHYGRWLKLGRTGLSSRGGNNGLVILIRPDAKEKLTFSVGRGLMSFTSVDYGRIFDGEAMDYLNFQNYDQGVRRVISLTDSLLRQIYPPVRKH
jgi:uncharacterized membrane protein YgcG